jgi:hypothetical protein
LGISFTMIAGFTILVFITASIVQYSLSNTIVTSLIIPSNQNSTKELKFQINLKLYNFIGECSIFPFKNLNGIIGNYSYSNIKRDEYCSVNFDCYKCDLTGTTTNIYFNFTDYLAASSTFSYNMSINYIKNSTYNLQNGIFIENGILLKGPDPTTFQMLITNTQYQTLKSNILDIPQESSINYGFTVNQLSYVLGSRVNKTSFSSQNGLNMLFQFSLNYNTIYIEEVNKSSFLNFLAQIAALLGAILSIYSTIISVIENIFLKLKQFIKLLIKKFSKLKEEDKKNETIPKTQEKGENDIIPINNELEDIDNIQNNLEEVNQ